MIKNFSTQNLREVFAEENKYENFRSLASNLVRGNAIFELDDNGNERTVNKTDANKAIRKVLMEVCGLTEEDLKSKKKRERAEMLHGVELFEIIEEDIEFVINQGWRESEWFDQFVEYKSTALGDANAFIPPTDKKYLIIGDVAGDHHDITMQQFAEGQEFMVECKDHAVKIGKDIDLVILGRYDYTKMINKIAEAFTKDIQDMVFTAVYAASDEIPASAPLKITGELNADLKGEFDELIENVEVANDSEVVIMGTKTALKRLNNLTDVKWIADSQKEAIANSGRLGNYEGTTLMEIPQRLKVGSFEKLIPNDTLLVMPIRNDRFVKMFDLGETQIYQITDKFDLKDDFQTYEVHRSYGCKVILGQYFGRWDKE